MRIAIAMAIANYAKCCLPAVIDQQPCPQFISDRKSHCRTDEQNTKSDPPVFLFKKYSLITLAAARHHHACSKTGDDTADHALRIIRDK